MRFPLACVIHVGIIDRGFPDDLSVKTRPEDGSNDIVMDHAEN